MDYEAEYGLKVQEMLERVPWCLVVLSHLGEGDCVCGRCSLPWSAVVSARLRGGVSRLRRADKKLSADLSFGSCFITLPTQPQLYITDGIIFGHSCRCTLSQAVVRLERFGWYQVVIEEEDLDIMPEAYRISKDRKFIKAVLATR